MIQHLRIDGGTTVRLRAERAEGAIHFLAAEIRKAPWLKFDGAEVSWLDGDTERGFVLTPERAKYLRARANDEAPDPGTAEVVCEYLWSEGLPAVPVARVSPGGIFMEPEVEVTMRILDRAMGYRVRWAPRRDTDLAMHAFHQALRETTRAFPPEIEVREASSEPDAKQRFNREPLRRVAQCVGCGEVEKFSADVLADPHDFGVYVQRTMAHRHQLCGARHAWKIAEDQGRRTMGVSRFDFRVDPVRVSSVLGLPWLVRL